MNDHTSRVHDLATRITKLIDREAKRKPLDAVQVCGALGLAAAAVASTAVPEGHPEADHVLLGSLGLGFSELLPALRVAQRGPVN